MKVLESGSSQEFRFFARFKSVLHREIEIPGCDFVKLGMRVMEWELLGDSFLPSCRGISGSTDIRLARGAFTPALKYRAMRALVMST